ncbi:MAG TPA: amidase [Streptosporangiaceae bacterium]|jgi:amidase
MATYITRLDGSGNGNGPRLAVKDLIDVQGVPTTAGSAAVADQAGPAAADAACLAGARAAGAVIVGKVNLNELAYGASGLNEHFGTPRNPLDAALLPGGSSSGSAVAVADGEADVAYGSDTGGSIRVPAAYCGIAGLKTTHGRVSLAGVWPLAPSLDTVGPMATDVAGLVTGMELLEPGFAAAAAPAVSIGRLRPSGVRADPVIDAAVDEALARSEISVTELDLDGWQDALSATYAIMDAEVTGCDGWLMADPARRARLGTQVRERLAAAALVTAGQADYARQFQAAWRATFDRLFRAVELLVMPSVAIFPAAVAGGDQGGHTRCTAPINLAGLPALSLPVPARHRLPASLQLIGPAGSEELLLATGAVIEAAAGYRRR